MTHTVLLVDRPFGSDEIERNVLASAGLHLERAPSSDTLTIARLAENAVAILVCYARVDESVISAARRGGCRVIARYGVGYDNIDVAAATRAGILVTYVPDYCLDEVADHTLALLLAAARGLVAAVLGVRAGKWEVPTTGVHRVQTRRLALIGLGRIGHRVAQRARAFGIEVVAFDPYLREWPAGMLRMPTLEEAVGQADYISLHLPLTEENRGLIGDETIAAMHRSPILVNTSRGGLVDLDAATRAVEEGQLGGLALDVTEVEPLPVRHPLRTHPKVIITPHMSFYSAEAQEELQRRVAAEVVDVIAGREPRSPVNPVVLSA